MADGDSIKGWILRCTTCSTVWVLEVSFDIRNIKMLYHFCNRCRRNTFHEVLGRAEEAPMSKDE